MKIEYIELFSGIGAFTQAIERVNTNDETSCLYAGDFNPDCAKVYSLNYGIDSLHDLTKDDDKKDIKQHNFCFFSPPCQAFSKSGHQKGFEDTRGTLIYQVFKILEKYKPKYILMENVRNLVSHDSGRTWTVINDALKNLGYRIPSKPVILSPHYFGVPQTRERAFIPGIYDPENVDKGLTFEFDNLMRKEDTCIYDIIDVNEQDPSLLLTAKENLVLDAWNEFYQNIDIKVIGFPIWADYFNSTIDIENYPEWKKEFIRKNRELYQRNKTFIDAWIKKYDIYNQFTPTQRKFEWQAGTSINSINEALIQFRPSGVRAKAPTTAPALVAIVQVPILGRYRRRLSVKECCRLQSFPDDFNFGDISNHEKYKQLGNSINVTVLQKVVEKLLKIEEN